MPAGIAATPTRGRDPVSVSSTGDATRGTTLALLPLRICGSWRAGWPASSRRCRSWAARSCCTRCTSTRWAALRLSSAHSLALSHVARGVGVALVHDRGASWCSTSASLALGTAGVALVVLGDREPARLPAGTASWPGRAILWPVLTGLTIAAYSILDKAGVGRLEPGGLHAAARGRLRALLGTPLLWVRSDRVRRELAGWRTIVAAAVMSALASPRARAVRLPHVEDRLRRRRARELSIVLSAVIGSVWLRRLDWDRVWRGPRSCSPVRGMRRVRAVERVSA